MENNTRVLYRNKRYYIYNENESCVNCSLNDWVTIPNIVLQYMANFAAKSPPFVQQLIKFALSHFEHGAPFIRITVNQV
ncbi:unnamed protein product [Onchocerca flexuosa]|uniref:Uncharacterized protein n=1 Tax=Onchocerca flexuosa TaxID=387005 RepID=A0A183HPE6_9BILA|nr:unnamed protein product [Onchocerca flexuosa]